MGSENTNPPNAFIDCINRSQDTISSILTEIILYPAWFISVRKILKPLSPTVDVVDDVFKTNGMMGLYSGMAIGVAHQSLYNVISRNTCRVLNKMIDQECDKEVQERTERQIDLKKATSMIIASGVAALATTPLQTLQNNIISYPSLSVTQAYSNLTTVYGASVLFRGALPNVLSSMIKKFVYIFGSPHIVDLFSYISGTDCSNSSTGNTVTLMASSLLSTFCAAPFQFALVYLQATTGFSSMTDVWSKMTQNGSSILWTGFIPHFLYESPRQLLTWYLNTKINKVTESFGGPGYSRPC